LLGGEVSHLDRFSVGFGKLLLTNRIVILLAVLTLFFIAANGAKNLGFDTNYRVFFSDKNPQLTAFETLQNVYTKTDNIVFVLKPKSGDVFEPNTLKAVQELTEASWKLPFSTRVDSLSNYQHTYAIEDDLIVEDLVEEDPSELTEENLQHIKKVALSEPTLVNRTISPEATATGVNITFHFPEKDPFEVPQTTQEARKLLASFQERYPDIEMVGSGVVYMNNAFAESSQNDMKTLIPIMYGILIITMMVLLRSFLTTLAVLVVIALSAIFAMGIAGWAGIRLTPPSAIAPTIILTLAIADSIHIIISMFKEMRRGLAKNEAIIESIRINFQPILLTSITTAIGFLSLNFSDAPPFHDLGNITAVGVIAAFFFSILVLPIILSVIPIKIKSQQVTHPFFDRLSDFVIAKRKSILVLFIGLIGFLSVMISRIDLNDQFVQYFDYSIPFRGEAEFVMDNLTGLYQIEYSVGAEEEGGIANPKYLERLEAFTNWLTQHPKIQHVYSVTDIFKRLNKNMHGDQEEWYRLPEEKTMAAQYLLLYEMSLPYGLDLNDRVNLDKSATRVTVTTYDLSTKELRALKRESEQWLQENTPKYMHTEATSPTIMFAYISERNINSMMLGNTVALVLISLCILIALKSVRMGVISLVPNLVPAIMGFGIWGLFVGQVNMAVALVAAVSLGIIVDDTVHFLSKYYRARKEKGLNAQEAVHYAFSTVGAALVVTTVVLAAGFSMLLFSGFQMNSTLGALTTIIITCALIADFLLLPALLIKLDKNKGESS
jgi:predicted RND superfamily exporter protein